MIANHQRKYKQFRETLIEARKAKGITQEELGKKLGVPQSLISKIERGVRRLDLVETLAILRALSIEPARFIKQVLSEID